eukprot:3455616-Prymnesium_polylepis.1
MPSISRTRQWQQMTKPRVSRPVDSAQQLVMCTPRPHPRTHKTCASRRRPRTGPRGTCARALRARHST